MYQSNQARIKKEIPSLLLGLEQGPRPASSHPRVNSARGTVAAASPSLRIEREREPRRRRLLRYPRALFTRGWLEAGRGPCPRPSKREGISFFILAGLD